MAVPYDLYLRFLVTKGFYDISAVNAALDQLFLPNVSQQTFDVQYNLVMKTLPAGIQTQIETKFYSSDFLQWMRALGVDTLWYYEGPYENKDKKGCIKLVYDLHADQHLRLSLDALLMKGIKKDDISRMLANKFSALLQELHIALYELFFFNSKAMTRADWRRYLNLCGNKERSIYFLALTEPVDVVKTELELSSRTSVSELLQYHVAKVHYRAKECLQVNTPESAAEARAWLQSLGQLVDKYEKYRAADTEDFASAIQMEFEYTDGNHPSPDAEVLRELSDRAEKAKNSEGTRGS